MYSLFTDDNGEMNATLWVLVAIKIFILFWFVYYFLDRRKQKSSVNNLAAIEQGMVASYSGAPVTQVSKSCDGYINNQQLYPNLMPPIIQPSTGINVPQSHAIPIK